MAEAKIWNLALQHDSRRHFILSTFGYSGNGQGELKFRAENIQVVGPRDSSEFRFGFVLESVEEGRLLGDGDDCIIADPKLDRALAQEIYLKDATSEQTKSEKRTWKWKDPVEFAWKIPKGGIYHFYASSCYHKGTEISAAIHVEQSNIVTKTQQKYYLSVGDAHLPFTYFLMSFLFCGISVLWCWLVFDTQKEHAKKIHKLMCVVVACKAFTLFAEAFMIYWEKWSGSIDNGWNIVYYIAKFFKGIFLFLVIALIGTGWSYFKDFLTARDKNIIWTIFVLQVLINIAWISVEELMPGNPGWISWRDIFYIADILCCLATLFPIVWSIRHLIQLSKEHGGMKAEENASRLRRFRRFYLLVIIFVYLTRIISLFLDATLSYSLSWIGALFKELSAFMFFFSTGYLFRPRVNFVYMSVTMEEDGQRNEIEMGKLEENN